MYFYTINIGDTRVRGFVDAIRVVLNPEIKHTAHITFKGPLKRIDRNFLEKNKNEKYKVSIIGISNFFLNGQNTIYFRCGTENLRKIWKKPDYAYNPHITLYDGKDTEFSREIYAEIKNKSVYFSFESIGLSYLKSSPGQSNTNILSDLDVQYALKNSNIDSDFDSIKNLTSAQRIKSSIKILESLINGFK